MATRAPTPAERDAAWQLGNIESADQAYTLAVGGIQFVVDAKSPITALSVAQLRNIYSGRTRQWSDVGGPGRPIRAAWSGAHTASGELLGSAVMQGARVDATVVQANRVLRDADVIQVWPLARPVPSGMRAIAVSDGGIAVRPTRAAVMSEDYPLARRYTLYGAPLMSALGRSLALYAVSRPGQNAVERAGALSVMLRPLKGATPATVELADGSLSGATRLPLSLRFDPASIDGIFDARAVRDMERLDALMHAPGLRGRAVVVVAFVDRQREGRLVAEQFANDRADYVATLLGQRGIRVARVRGLGDVAPLATGADSRHRNERVEIWLL